MLKNVVSLLKEHIGNHYEHDFAVSTYRDNIDVDPQYAHTQIIIRRDGGTARYNGKITDTIYTVFVFADSMDNLETLNDILLNRKPQNITKHSIYGYVPNSAVMDDNNIDDVSSVIYSSLLEVVITTRS